MNGEIGNNHKKVSIVELKDYLSKEKYNKYIFSSNYQSNINNYTLRCSMIFDQLDVLFNPNKIFIHSRCDSTDKGQYIVIEKVKYAYIEELEYGILMEIVCGNISNDIDNHTYTVVAEIFNGKLYI